MLPEQEWAKTHSCLLSQVITNKSVLCHAAEWKVSLTRPAAGVGIRQAGFYSKFVIATRMSRVITQTTE
ncbi:MAG: hypothetical protein EGR91_00215 [Lachnospiraceae bacterium]|nr:hypothetical protein [Lachnospiraceae bacterium]